MNWSPVLSQLHVQFMKKEAQENKMDNLPQTTTYAVCACTIASMIMHLHLRKNPIFQMYQCNLIAWLGEHAPQTFCSIFLCIKELDHTQAAREGDLKD